MTSTPTVTFEPPGVGQWSLDRSHFPGGTTPIVQQLIETGMQQGMERVFGEIGVPARHMRARFVHGFMYTRLIPLVGGDASPRTPPPSIVLKVLTRVIPEFRRRTRRAERALVDREFADVVERWEREMRPTLVATNTRFQAFDVDAADDDSLQAHIVGLLDHLTTTYELHFWLHGHDLGPIARYLHSAIGWGLEPSAAIAALAGASPTTVAPLERLVRIRRLVDATGGEVSTLDDVRAVSPEAAELLDEHLAERGHVLVSGYDITSFTLAELPEVTLSTIRSARIPADPATEGTTEALRNQVPVGAGDEFDALLADARLVMDMRDDNGPQTVEWPTGLLRRALLAAGRRLAERDAVHSPEDILELRIDEARVAFGEGLPGADELSERATRRAAQHRLDPPDLLGPAEAEPPLDAMPAPLAKLVAMVQTAVTHLGMDGTAAGPAVDPLTGVGIGTDTYTGRVCTAETADEAIEKLEPGDVLVVRATSPAFNAVLAIAGAVVTANGGALSHAAVLARELGIPAIVGASGALTLADGAIVEVDPVAGRVSLS